MTMRLLDVYTGQFVEMDPKKGGIPYAILSHTWAAGGEQTHQELKKIQERYAAQSRFQKWIPRPFDRSPLSAIWTDRRLSPKILHACRVARENGYRYIWIDSCCIDKTSSSELSEAINSMYRWYGGADLCFAYLADVPPEEDPQKDGSSFRNSRWFKRGWTLQELIVPKNLVFLSMDWARLGTKDELVELVHATTDISVDALSGAMRPYSFSVAQRFSWAGKRETTRVEDEAYSLLGIFDINMPTLYGEGERAFQRLQEEILRRIPDQSIFAWGDVYLGLQALTRSLDTLNLELLPSHWFADGSWHYSDVNPHSSLSPLSPSAGSFVDSRSIETVPLSQLFYHYPDLPAPEYSFTPIGIRTHLPLIPLPTFLPEAITNYYMDDPSGWYLAVLGCQHVDRPGHLLGLVCAVSPSPSRGGIRLLIPGRVRVSSIAPDGQATHQPPSALVALSPDSALARSSGLASVVPVYLRTHPHDSWTLFGSDMSNRPHKTVHLLLKRKNDPTTGPRPIRLRRSSLDEAANALSLRWPDQDHPTTHWLTISKRAPQRTDTEVQDTITIEYTYTLEHDGAQLVVEARASGMLLGHPIIPVTLS